MSNSIDSIDLDSNNIVLHIPLLTYKQRGSLPDFTLVARYNASNWFSVEDDLAITPNDILIRTPPQDDNLNIQNYPYWDFWGTGVQIVRGEALSGGNYDLPFTDSNGEPNDYQVTYVEDSSGAQHLLYLPSTTGVARAMDGSGIAATATDPRSNLTKIIDSNGILHTAVGDNADDGFYDALSDPLGTNTITPVVINGYTSFPFTQVDHWVDSIGRNIPAPPNQNPGRLYPGCYTYQYPSYISTSTATQPYTFCYTDVQVSSAFGLSNISDYGPVAHTFLTSIQLPNGHSYSFGYDTWGELWQIGLPTGGTITYTWITGPSVGSSTSRFLIGRTLDPKDGTLPRTWTYCVAVLPGCGSIPGTARSVIDPEGNETVHDSFANSTVVYQGRASNGIAMQSTTKSFCTNTTGDVFWRSPAREPQLVCQTDTSLADGEISRETVTYDTPILVGDPVTAQECCGAPNALSSTGYRSIGIPVTRAVSNYGITAPGSTLKTTATQYLWQTDRRYLEANLIELPSVSTISDGNGNILSQTTYGYDGDNGSPQGIYGEKTSVSDLVNAGSPSTTSTAVYNPQGMVTDTYDANLEAGVAGNHVNTAYDSTGLFPSSVTQTMTAGASHADYYSYDANTGNINSHTDQNGNRTIYSYDLLGRMTSTTTPDGGSIQVNYNGDPTPPNVTVTTAIGTNTPPMVVTHLYDGLGRSTETQMNDPDGTVYTDTSYDAVGNIASVSNPYRSKSDPTFGYTSYAYDALGRKTMLCRPDNLTPGGSCVPGTSYQQWIYSGSTTTFSDENRNAWQRTTDPLARLTSVVEPGSLTTTYRYDALSNLISVNQSGGPSDVPRVHSFTYDSLSRLITASNPETGTICYGIWSGNNCVNGYDANGNLLYKTDARGLTTGYLYDALNRVLSKTSTHASSTTPSSCYQYDQTPSSLTGVIIPNAIGRLTAEWTQVGSCPTSGQLPASGFLTSKTILAYDPIGRVKNTRQCTSSSCSSPFSFAYDYDLAGNTTGANNGVGTISWLPTYDAAGRLLSVGAVPVWSGPQFSTQLFNSPVYGPAGITSWTMGNPVPGSSTPAISVTTKTYDNRLRVTSESVNGHQ